MAKAETIRIPVVLSITLSTGDSAEPRWRCNVCGFESNRPVPSKHPDAAGETCPASRFGVTA